MCLATFQLRLPSRIYPSFHFFSYHHHEDINNDTFLLCYPQNYTKSSNKLLTCGKMHLAIIWVTISSVLGIALAATTATGCSINSGQNGVCISTGSCKSGGGKSEAGHCPGAADIQVYKSSKIIGKFRLTMQTVLHLR